MPIISPTNHETYLDETNRFLSTLLPDPHAMSLQQDHNSFQRTKEKPLLN